MMVPYAGQDPEEPPLSVPETKFLHRKSHTRPERAYRMFLAGADTLEISRRLRYSEATVLRWITAERCRRLGLRYRQLVEPKRRIQNVGRWCNFHKEELA